VFRAGELVGGNMSSCYCSITECTKRQCIYIVFFSECNICKVSHWIWDIGDKPEHDPLNNNNYIYIFRNIKNLKLCPFSFVCMSHLSIILYIADDNIQTTYFNFFINLLISILHRLPHHHIAVILLKLTLNTNQNQSINQ
jgi:hypothetical protein